METGSRTNTAFQRHLSEAGMAMRVKRLKALPDKLLKDKRIEGLSKIPTLFSYRNRDSSLASNTHSGVNNFPVNPALYQGVAPAGFFNT